MKYPIKNYFYQGKFFYRTIKKNKIKNYIKVYKF